MINLFYGLVEKERVRLDGLGERFNFIEFCASLNQRFVFCLFNAIELESCNGPGTPILALLQPSCPTSLLETFF